MLLISNTREIFIEVLILNYFNLEYHIYIKIDTFYYIIDKILS